MDERYMPRDFPQEIKERYGRRPIQKRAPKVKAEQPTNLLLHHKLSEQVLRTKLFQEGGNDEDIQPVVKHGAKEMVHVLENSLTSINIKNNQEEFKEIKDKPPDPPDCKNGLNDEAPESTMNQHRPDPPSCILSSLLAVQNVGEPTPTRSDPTLNPYIFKWSCMDPFMGSFHFPCSSSFQSFIWKPGEPLHHIEAPIHVPSCTVPHLISPRPNLPFLDPKGTKSQWFFTILIGHDLESFYTTKRLPRMHHYMPKLSRYKEPPIFLIWPKIEH